MYELNDIISKKRMKQMQSDLADLRDNFEDVRDKVGTLAKKYGKKYERTEFRKPWVYHKAWYEGATSLIFISLLVSAVVAGIAYLLFRNPEEGSSEFYAQNEAEKWPSAEKQEANRPESSPEGSEHPKS